MHNVLQNRYFNLLRSLEADLPHNFFLLFILFFLQKMKDIEEKKGPTGKKRKTDADDSEQFVGVRNRIKMNKNKNNKRKKH